MRMFVRLFGCLVVNVVVVVVFFFLTLFFVYVLREIPYMTINNSRMIRIYVVCHRSSISPGIRPYLPQWTPARASKHL